MEFYGIVVAVASVFLILCLILVGILMQNMSPDVDFPPISNSCPDNWVIQGNTCTVPSNGVNVGIVKDIANHASFIKDTYGIKTEDAGQKGNFKDPLTGNTYVDFNDDGWKSTGSVICEKKKWTNQYGISWDGVSNTTGCAN